MDAILFMISAQFFKRQVSRSLTNEPELRCARVESFLIFYCSFLEINFFMLCNQKWRKIWVLRRLLLLRPFFYGLSAWWWSHFKNRMSPYLLRCQLLFSFVWKKSLFWDLLTWWVALVITFSSVHLHNHYLPLPFLLLDIICHDTGRVSEMKSFY